MRRWAVMLVLVIVTASYARADEASKRAKVEELVAVMHLDRQMDQMMSLMKAQVEQTVHNVPGMESLTTAQKKAVSDFQDKAFQLVADSMSWKALEPDFVSLYSQNFTEDELDGMIAFYKSPSGQAVLNKMPQLMTASMQLVQQKMMVIQPKLKELQDQFMAQLAASSPQPLKKSSSPMRKN